MVLDLAAFVALVDHTLLKPAATADDIEQLCIEAARLGTRAACVNGYWVPTAVAALADAPPVVCAVVGFPLGAGASAAKAHEAVIAVEAGAAEIDMVVNQGLVAANDQRSVGADIAAVRAAVDGAVLKVIVESATLTPEALAATCRTAVGEGADFVKTSTGFDAAGGASTEAVRLMRATVGAAVGVKASGGIRSLADATAMVDAGADRLGLSATAAIAAELGAR